MWDWLKARSHEVSALDVGIAALVSIGLLAASLALAALVVTLWPADHFVTDRPLFAERHPAVRLLLAIARNALGALIVAAGVILALPGVPGPGLAVAFIGLTLIDFPGKRRVELWVVQRPAVREAINRIRGRFGREPLLLDVAPRAPQPR